MSVNVTFDEQIDADETERKRIQERLNRAVPLDYAGSTFGVDNHNTPLVVLNLDEKQTGGQAYLAFTFDGFEELVREFNEAKRKLKNINERKN